MTLLSEKLISEISKKNIRNVALGVNRGDLDQNAFEGLTQGFVETKVLKKPKSQWAKTVDCIEAPFAEDYDNEEYSQNRALSLMGLYEMREMLRTSGIPTAKQTEYKSKLLEGKTAMVVGTGTGREVLYLAANGADVVGIDATKKYVDITADKVSKNSSAIGDISRIDLFQCPAEEFEFGRERFDVISILFGVINHIKPQKKVLVRMTESLKPDGKLVIEKYGSNSALVFALQKEGLLGYKPSILQRRDPKDKGILLGDSEEILPASFPNDREFSYQIESSGLNIDKRIGFLRIASLYPKEPTGENIQKYIELVATVDPKAYEFIFRATTADELLLRSFIYDLKSQKRQDDPPNIEDFAYVFYVGQKVQRPEGLRFPLTINQGR